jgi:hypothetical protein
MIWYDITLHCITLRCVALHMRELGVTARSNVHFRHLLPRYKWNRTPRGEFENSKLTPAEREQAVNSDWRTKLQRDNKEWLLADVSTLERLFKAEKHIDNADMPVAEYEMLLRDSIARGTIRTERRKGNDFRMWLYCPESLFGTTCPLILCSDHAFKSFFNGLLDGAELRNQPGSPREEARHCLLLAHAALGNERELKMLAGSGDRQVMCVVCSSSLANEREGVCWIRASRSCLNSHTCRSCPVALAPAALARSCGLSHPALAYVASAPTRRDASCTTRPCLSGSRRRRSTRPSSTS